MEDLLLIKYGEISLKGKNRYQFENNLLSNIKKQLKAVHHSITRRPGRIYLSMDCDNMEKTINTLKNTFGIESIARAIKTDKTVEAIDQAALKVAKTLFDSGNGPAFKIEAKRTDKSFPLTSYQIACRLGNLLKKKIKDLIVNVNRPDWIINVEIREKTYIYSKETKAVGGLPVGCSGKGLLLLSGGIDSPVAGYLMAGRGLAMDAVYFHTPPFTSTKVEKKVNTIAQRLAPYIPGLTLYIINFTNIQLKIKEQIENKAITLFSRTCMIMLAEKLAKINSLSCLITGESLSQVASQTVENITFTNSHSSLPIFRPLIGMSKQRIMGIAQQIGTYNISIQPYDDCCTLFAPEHPVIKPNFAEYEHIFSQLDLAELLTEAVSKVKTIQFK